MAKYAKYVVYLAIAAFVLSIILRLGAFTIGNINASTLLKATYALLLFAIAFALVKE